MKKSERARVERALKGDRLPRKPLARLVRARAKKLTLTRSQMAERVDDAASQMSRLMTGHDDEFSADRLVGYLLDLGCDVRVTVVAPNRPLRYTRRGQVRVDATGTGV